ncbi:hypothetical protein [Amphritea sp.]|uniref:hypothetical protein n=1 Tax=Amphritea sp. TaxID=1872502 RepID=UPI0025BB28CA|nr:hypothetical protein [Amphritea sp.]
MKLIKEMTAPTVKYLSEYFMNIPWKRIGIHILTHIEKYQLIVIGLLALLWNFNSDSNWPEPLLVLMTVIFAAIALKKIIIKGNVDEELEKIISRSHPINDWYSNEEFSENEHVAVYRKDPAIVISLYHDPVNKDFKEQWLNKLFPAPQVSSHRVSIKYSGGELFSKLILLVDGGRVYLPLPKSPLNLETTQFDLAICQILNGQTGYDTAYYFKRTSIILDRESLEQKA